MAINGIVTLWSSSGREQVLVLYHLGVSITYRSEIGNPMTRVVCASSTLSASDKQSLPFLRCVHRPLFTVVL